MEELIKSALDGNKDSYVALIKSIETELFKIASSQLNNIDDVNDAIQETILNSYSKLHTLKNYNYFKTWIIRILINECNKFYRNQKKRFRNIRWTNFVLNRDGRKKKIIKINMEIRISSQIRRRKKKN